MATKGSAFQRMHLEEIEQRAWIFYNLKRSKDYARKRIVENLRWEFECVPSPLLEKKVDEIINHVYKKSHDTDRDGVREFQSRLK
jgi:hypothetical protein